MTLDEQIAILQAAKAGKPLQVRDGEAWRDVHYKGGWRFNFVQYEWRIKPEPRVAYFNFYTGGASSGVYPTRESADTGKTLLSPRIACVRVEYQEGQFDQ